MSAGSRREQARLEREFQPDERARTWQAMSRLGAFTEPMALLG